MNLEEISELLKKGVDNPSLQNDEGRFSAAKWKSEIQKYTEPFLQLLIERLSGTLSQEAKLWESKKFEIFKKTEGKQKRIVSLQDATCKLPEPFALSVSDNSRRPIEGCIVIGPNSDSIGAKYSASVCWGLRWWGTAKKAELVHEIFGRLNEHNELTASMLKDGSFGGFYAWLFNFIPGSKLVEKGFESIADMVTRDFSLLSTALDTKKDLFRSIPEPGYLPCKRDLEKVIQSLWSATGRMEIKETEVLNSVEAELKKRGVALKRDWQKKVEDRLKDWFGNQDH